ncbi:MAG TPA: HAMP domain-containing sensor histidine kinase, partial [Azospirillaceae bacterium]|nr:HAMP domain-containing sensor histidine kinase [Azospirillaceae bacterium]
RSHAGTCSPVPGAGQTSAERDRLAAEARRLAAENAAKSDFLVNLGQLLHGPLNDTAARAQALMSDLHMHGLTESANDAEALQWSAERLAGRLEALMDYARIEAGRGELCLQDFDVARLLVETRERMTAQADLHGLTLTAAPAADVGGMHSDFAKVRQALLNLADNACVHSRGATVTLSAERVTRDGRAWVVFSVTDDGVGFPATRAAELFRPFARGAAKSPERGAGLGLTLAAHYVAMLGGELEVASAQGRGARFSLLLPAVFMPEDETRQLKARIGEPGGRLGAPLALLEG